MLTSKAWLRRFARKSSALGAMVVLTGSVLTVLGTAQAAHAAVDQTMTINFTCTGGAFAGTTNVQAKITTPDAVASATTSFPVKWDFVSLKPTKELAAQTKIEIEGDLTVTGGTPAALAIDQNMTLTTAASANANITVPQKSETVTPSGATVTVAPPAAGTLGVMLRTVAATGTAEEETTCNVTSATPTNLITTTSGGGGGGTGTDVIDYKCTGPTASDVQNVQIKVELTAPTDAKVGSQFTIKWKGTYTAGKELKGPATGTLGAKIFAYATLTGITGLTSATGDGTTGTVTANQPITLPAAGIDLKSTASAAGTATMKAGAVNFGANSTGGTEPKIQCEVQTANPKTWTFTVAAATGNNPTPTPTPTPTTPRPTTTKTVVVTETPKTPIGKVTKTPKAGAETGGGGEMGPDGRNFVMAGTAMILAAGVGGLMMRRRRSVRG
ncbi:hypothetical protein ACIBG7_04980 [Nonomuraea sp. NPDC050328]|uniref:hypothetical protein n=1 Tax=Nonomuraea sp. NPDC050328 TaxID=3364361 RepID=UPI0037B94832